MNNENQKKNQFCILYLKKLKLTTVKSYSATANIFLNFVEVVFVL
jgi:hypothetical protein